jgi:hypothetical protein
MTLQHDVDLMTAADVEAAASADLIPTGTYEGQVVDFKLKPVDKDDSPYTGTDMARVTVELFDVQGKSRKHFFNASNIKRTRDDGRLLGPSMLYGQLVNALTRAGAVTGPGPLEQTLEAAKPHRLRFRVRLAPAKGQYEASNWTDAITVSTGA